MYGVVTRNAEELSWPEFDRGFYEIKDVTGRAADPVENGVNMLSCFGDNATAEERPDLVPVDGDGNRATRDQPSFDWAYVCPTADRYREGLLEIVDEAIRVAPDLRLDDVGFPRQGYCRCDRCTERFAASEYDEWEDWRASVVTEFVAAVRARVPGRLYCTVYPDPYPGHLRTRSGVDVAALAEYVDEFVVPLYDMAYTTTYWIETIAGGFADLLSAPFSVELYAVDVDVGNLVHATEVAASYGESVLFGYDAGNARAAVRRIRADTRDGESYGPAAEEADDH